jgi:hypothetical protein
VNFRIQNKHVEKEYSSQFDEKFRTAVTNSQNVCNFDRSAPLYLELTSEIKSTKLQIQE